MQTRMWVVAGVEWVVAGVEWVVAGVEWVVAGVEWVQALGIVRVAVKGCVRGSSVEARILVGMVACQARSQGRWNLTPLDSQQVVLVHPEMGLQQLLTMPLASCPHSQRLGHWGRKLQR